MWRNHIHRNQGWLQGVRPKPLEGWCRHQPRQLWTRKLPIKSQSQCLLRLEGCFPGERLDWAGFVISISGRAWKASVPVKRLWSLPKPAWTHRETTESRKRGPGDEDMGEREGADQANSFLIKNPTTTCYPLSFEYLHDLGAYYHLQQFIKSSFLSWTWFPGFRSIFWTDSEQVSTHHYVISQLPLHISL